MTVNITSKQMEITPAIRQHVADRLAKLEKWQTHLINPHIILSKEPQGFIADATINTPNGHLVASAKHEDMYTAINDLINKLERQLVAAVLRFGMTQLLEPLLAIIFATLSA